MEAFHFVLTPGGTKQMWSVNDIVFTLVLS